MDGEERGMPLTDFRSERLHGWGVGEDEKVYWGKIIKYVGE